MCDLEKFKSLQKLVREYNVYKSLGDHNKYKLKIKSEFVQKLKDYKPNLSKFHKKL